MDEKEFLVPGEIIDILYRSVNYARQDTGISAEEHATAIGALDELTATYADGSKEPAQ